MVETMYCMRCKKSQEYKEFTEGINKRGLRMLKATCPGCQKDMFKIASKKTA